jgi:hypothetical protein
MRGTEHLVDLHNGEEGTVYGRSHQPLGRRLLLPKAMLVGTTYGENRNQPM